jgi:hypothetical protein
LAADPVAPQEGQPTIAFGPKSLAGDWSAEQPYVADALVRRGESDSEGQSRAQYKMGRSGRMLRVSRSRWIGFASA